MITIWGTSYFPTEIAAFKYYREYGCSRADIKQKVADGEIHIGKPPLKHGERLVLIDMRTRYAIETNE